MKLVQNRGTDRVVDLMRPHLQPGHRLGCVTPSFSLFAFAELRDALAKLEGVQLILPPADDALDFLGGDGGGPHAEPECACRKRNGIYAVARKIAHWQPATVIPTSPPLAPTKPSARRSTSFEPLAALAFGETVRSMREGLGLAQDQFALIASVDRSYYGKLERGERQPTLGLLLRIARGLGVPGATLVEKTESTLKRLGKPSARLKAR